MSESRPRARAAALGMAAVTALFLGVSWLTFDQIEEDAFIFFRVAENLAAGAGFTFNAGAPPIECSSSLTYQLLLVPLALLSADPVLPAKLLGLGFGVLGLWLTFALGRRLFEEPLLAVLPPALLAVSLPFHQWAQRGLETPAYVCTLLAAVSCVLHPKLARWWFVAAFAVAATRPEGPLVALGFVLLLIGLRGFREIPDFRRGLVAFVALGALLLCLRVLYFHDFVPNPFYTKFHGSSAPGWKALGTFAWHGGGLWIAAPAALAVLGIARWSRGTFLVAGMALLTTLWAGLGEDWKPYNRHLVPALPFLSLLAVYAARLLAPGGLPRRLAVAYFAGVGLFLLLGARAVYDFTETWPNPLTRPLDAAPDPRVRTPASDRIGDNWQAQVGKFLQLNYPTGITIVYDQMGQTPWYAGRDKVFVDTLGLVNREVGVGLFRTRHQSGALGAYYDVSQAVLSRLWPTERRSLAGVGLVDYFFERAPDLMLFHEDLLAQPNSLPARLHRDPRVQARYGERFRLMQSVRVLEREGLDRDTPWRAPPGCTVEPL